MKKRLYIIAYILLISSATIAGVLITSHRHSATALAAEPPKEKSDKQKRYNATETVAFRDMISVSHRFNALTQFYMQGSIQANNPSDNAGGINTTFVFCKRENEFYYRMGEQEMIALRTMFIDIDKHMQKIMVSAPKQVMPPRIMETDSLVNMWQQESYSITRDSSAQQVSIRLLCEQHATCKEYRLTYDVTTGLPTAMYMRLTDINDPSNKAKDKIAEFRITRLQTQPIAALLDPVQYLRGQREAWTAAPRYAGYEIIND